MTDISSGDCENTCNDCDEHGTYCHNSSSDHYGHMLAECHPACEDFVKYQEPDIYCEGCKMEYVENKGDLCPDCLEKEQKNRPWFPPGGHHRH